MEDRNITNSGKPKKFYREEREDFQKFFVDTAHQCRCDGCY